MIEGLIGGVLALCGYAWFKHCRRKSKLADADRQKQLDKALDEAAPKLIKELITASGLAILGYRDGAAQWRKAAFRRVKLIYAGEVCNVLRPGYSREFVLRVEELLDRADIGEETRIRASILLYDLTGEVMCNPGKLTTLQRSRLAPTAKVAAEWV